MSQPRCQRCTPPAQVAVTNEVVQWAGMGFHLILCRAHADIFTSMLAGWTRSKRVPRRRDSRRADRDPTPEGRTTVHRLRLVEAAAKESVSLDGDAQRNRSNAVG